MAAHHTSSHTDKLQAAMASTGMNWPTCVMEARCWHTKVGKEELGLLRGLAPGSWFPEFCPYQLGLILVQHSMGRRTSGTLPTGHPVFISGNYSNRQGHLAEGCPGESQTEREHSGTTTFAKKSLFGKAKVKALR